MLVFYLDLDMIITGSLEPIIMNFEAKFATLSTDEIFCEQATDGYNSSVMLFGVEKGRTQV